MHFLVIDDDATFADVLARSLVRRGYSAQIAHNGDVALALVQGQRFDVAILDLKLSETTGVQLLPKLLAVAPGLRVIILTGYASIATTVEAMKLGAENYLCKPASTDEILAVLGGDPQPLHGDASDLPLSVDRLEWEYIQRHLVANKGNIAATARELGMHRRTLQRKLQKKPSRQ